MKILKTPQDFDEVLNVRGQLVVIDFFAEWCPPCKGIAPFFEGLVNKYPHVIFCKIDVDENEETTARCGVECMPTFLFYKDGEKISELVGANIKDLEAKVKDNQY